MDAAVASDATFRYIVRGPRAGQPIILLHGVGATRTMWTLQLDALSDAHRVIALDLPAHGLLAETPFSLSGAAERIARTIATEADGRALVVGLSLGGYVAMAFGAAYPQMAAGLVLAGCTLNPSGPLRYPYRAGSFAIRRANERWLQRISAMRGWTIRRILGNEIGGRLIAGGHYPQAVPAVVRELVRHDFRAMLRAYPGPTLFINGGRDYLFRSSELSFLAAAQRPGLVVVPRVGHISLLRQPEFTQAIRGFAAHVMQ